MTQEAGSRPSVDLLELDRFGPPLKRARFIWPFADLERPRLDRLEDNLYAAAFSLMKLLPARYILQAAEEQGRLEPGGAIIETTSGTFGLALAMLSATRGYRLTLVSDPVIDARLLARLRELGARVEIVREPASEGGFQASRLVRLNELLATTPGAFWPDQYGNAGNPRSYAEVAQHLVARLGRIDCLVGTVGTGGSMVGTSRYLRAPFPDLIAIGVDTTRSVLFGQDDGPRQLRGLGNSVLPKNLDHTAFDFVSWVPAGIAFRATRILHASSALYMGGTSGAAYLVARWWAQAHPNQRVVVLLPDEGHRYVDTIYSDEWLASIDGSSAALASEPVEVSDPRQGQTSWSWMHWNQRRLSDVLSAPASAR